MSSINHTEKAQGITFVLYGVLRSSLSSTHFQFVSRLSSENILLLLLFFFFPFMMRKKFSLWGCIYMVFLYIKHDLYETLAFVNTHSYEATFLWICIRNIYSYMALLKIGSINCRGLSSDKIKRWDIFLKCRQNYDVSFLFDTHSKNETEPYWRSEWGNDIKISSHSSNSRGVAILFRNTFQYHIWEGNKR